MLIAPHSYPREIQRGVTETLSLSVVDDSDGTAETPSAGTVSVYAGSTAVVDGAAVTAADPSTYSLTGATTLALALASDWLEVWSLTIAGTVHTFRRPAYLVRYPYRHVVQQSDLTELHEDLAARETAGTVDLDGYIQAADTIVRRDLIKRGNRPSLVIDAWALADAHRYKALELLFRDDALSVGDGRYSQLEDYYAGKYRDEWETVVLTYDADEDGTIDEGERRSARSVVMLTSRKGWY